MEIRSITISYSSIKKKRDKIKITQLKDIEKIESVWYWFAASAWKKSSNLRKVRKEKLQGHIIRPRTKWIEEGEEQSKYFSS